MNNISELPEYTGENYPSFGKKYNGEKAVISLTSWTSRINTVSKTLYSLIQQCPNFHIVLVLAEEEFPKMTAELPENLMLFVENEFIELMFVRKNYKSFKKILFTMDKYRDVPVISADDDCIYTCNYAQELYDQWVKDKNQDTFYSCYLRKIDGIPHLGGAATLFPPNIFKDFALKILKKSKIYLVTNQDDDFYTALRHKLHLINAKKSMDFRKVYKFHDEILPCNNEIKDKKENERNTSIKILMKYINELK